MRNRHVYSGTVQRTKPAPRESQIVCMYGVAYRLSFTGYRRLLTAIANEQDYTLEEFGAKRLGKTVEPLDWSAPYARQVLGNL